MKKLIFVFTTLFFCTCALVKPTQAQTTPPMAELGILDWLPWGDDKKLKAPTPQDVAKATNKCLKKGNPQSPNPTSKAAFWNCFREEMVGNFAMDNKELIICAMFSQIENGNPNSKSSMCANWPTCDPCQVTGECAVDYICADCCDFEKHLCILTKGPQAQSCDTEYKDCMINCVASGG